MLLKDLQETMKCEQCKKVATFHITEVTGPADQWGEVHLCEECARDYLNQPEEDVAPESLVGALASHLKMEKTAEELSRVDQKACPVCGITFYEFRHQGRLGCPHDYVCFEEELKPLIVNIHGAESHHGKQPRRGKSGVDDQTQLIRLRRDMRDAVQAEDYERASLLRDEIRRIENGE